MPAGEGPKFAKVVRDEAAVAELAVPDMDKLRYVFDAVGTIRKALADGTAWARCSIGFSGSPWTLACYMVEGGGSDDYRAVKTLMYQRPDLMAPHPERERRCRGAVPERADRSGRAGRDDF